MNIVVILSILFLISIVLAFRSLKHVQKLEAVKDVAMELKKGKVIFQNDSVSSSSAESSSSAA